MKKSPVGKFAKKATFEIPELLQEALNKRINEMGGPVDIPEEEQLESLYIVKDKNQEL